jgi:hypothetical protein
MPASLPREMPLLQQMHVNILRKIQRKQTTNPLDPHYTIDDVLSNSSILDITHQLMFNRLLYFARLIQHAPPATTQLLTLHHALHPAESYLSQIQLDLHQLQVYYTISLPPPTEYAMFRQALTTCNWKSIIHQAKHRAILYLQRKHHYQHVQADILKAMQAIKHGLRHQVRQSIR